MQTKILRKPFNHNDTSKRLDLKDLPLCNVCEDYFLSTPFQPFWRLARPFHKVDANDRECHVQAEENGPWISLADIKCGLCTQLVGLCPEFFEDVWIIYEIFRGAWDGIYPSLSYNIKGTADLEEYRKDKDEAKLFDILSIAIVDKISTVGTDTRFTIHARDDVASSTILQRDFDFHRTSTSAFQRISAWLGECQASHSKCAVSHKAKLPDRIIDVNGVDGPRLVLTQSLTGKEYAALSYCWGGDQVYKLLVDRIESYLEMLPMPDLPATITDAIEVTKSLGLQYLWVDALCIIQDDPADQLKQINQMRDIYSCSTLTISVGTASSVKDGFLFNNEAPVSSPEISLRLPDNRTGQISLYSVNSHDTLQYNPATSPLDSRAWTLQERVLPPRVVLYSSNTIQWLCNTHEAAYSLYPHDAPFGASSRRPRLLSEPASSQDQIYAWWSTLVEDYSSRSLTAATDKLPAISGLAEEYHQLTGDAYLGGLWRSQLPFDLLWRIEPPGSAERRKMFGRRVAAPIVPFRTRPEQYCAPSWSWASVADKVRFCERMKAPVTAFDVLGCRVCGVREEEPVGFGSVVKGELRVRARLRRGLWTPGETVIKGLQGNEVLPNVRVVPDAQDDVKGECRVVFIGVTSQEGLLLVRVGKTEEQDSKPVFRRVGLIFVSIFGLRSTLPDIWEGKEQKELIIV